MYEIYVAIISFLVGAFVMFTFIAISAYIKEDVSNKVHFYVARDKKGTMRLFFNKPIRVDKINIWAAHKRGFGICADYHFDSIGLNKDDYKDLKWEDEPVEVFLNMED